MAHHLDVLAKIGVHVLEYEVQNRLPFFVLPLLEIQQSAWNFRFHAMESSRSRGNRSIDRVPDYVRIDRQHPEKGYFAESGGRDALVVLGKTSLLESHDLSCSSLSCSVDLPVGSFSDFLQLLVEIHDSFSAHLSLVVLFAPFLVCQ